MISTITPYTFKTWGDCYCCGADSVDLAGISVANDAQESLGLPDTLFICLECLKKGVKVMTNDPR
ncbi:MAG: hypothetical protein KC475_09805 [Cyanobacteria bacterium HKST-UBA03]|nr:hypothetical protein [Cyanobacteria bacterium HKST-UBA03]